MFSTPVGSNNSQRNDIFFSPSSCSSMDLSEEESTFASDDSSQQPRQLSEDNQNDTMCSAEQFDYQLTTKRSRLKEHRNQLVLRSKFTQLNNENEILRAKIAMLTRKFGHCSGREGKQLLCEAFEATVSSIPDQSSRQRSQADDDDAATVILTEHLPTTPAQRRCRLFDRTSDL